MAIAAEHGLLISSITARPNMVSVSISRKALPEVLADMLPIGSKVGSK